MKETRSLLKAIWHKKYRWLGHVLNHENFLHDIMEGKLLGKATLVGKGWSYYTI